ncbi:MAG: hypothetical protein ACKO00_07385 [Crocinitomicaceae bacterium]
MKKLMILCAVLLALASCKKDWTCKCTSTTSQGTYSNSTTLSDLTKSDAKTECNSGDISAGVVTVDCELQ